MDEQIGERANSSRDSVRKVEKILEHMPPESKELEELRTGDLSINQAYDLIVKEESRKQLDNIDNNKQQEQIIIKQQIYKGQEEDIAKPEETIEIVSSLVAYLSGLKTRDERNTISNNTRRILVEKTKEHRFNLIKQLNYYDLKEMTVVFQDLYYLLKDFVMQLDDEWQIQKDKKELSLA